MTRHLIATLLALVLAAAAATAEDVGALFDHHGRPIAERDFGPDLRLLYFGYTRCPDACPVSLQTMSDALDALGPHGDRITPVFVTVDPERDTPEFLRRYIDMFHPRLVAVSGGAAAIAALAGRYRVKYAKADAGDDRPYTVDHTTTIFLTDRDGAVHGRFPHEIAPRELAQRILQRMAQMP